MQLKLSHSPVYPHIRLVVGRANSTGRNRAETEAEIKEETGSRSSRHNLTECTVFQLLLSANG
jgi:hypothetical protein